MEAFILFKPPFFYDSTNLLVSKETPTSVHVHNTNLSRYFQKYLIQKLISVYRWTVPDNWPLNYMLYVLYIWGYCAVVNTDRYGVIPQGCGLRGYNVCYQPTNAIISNPLLGGITEPKIGTECELLVLQPDYGGVYDIVGYYGDLMAVTAEAFGVNVMNSKCSYIFAARNQATANTFKKAVDNILSGSMCTVVDKDLFDTGGVEENFRVIGLDQSQFNTIPQLLTVLKQLEIMFDHDVGIPNVSTTTRERELVNEIESNNLNTMTKCALWLENLQKTCEKIRKMFGIQLDVDWRYKTDSISKLGGDFDEG